MLRGYFRIIVICMIAYPAIVSAGETKPHLQLDTPIQAVTPVGQEAVRTVAKAPTEQRTAIGYVDTGRIASESVQGKALKVLLTSKKEAIQDKISGKKKQLDKLKTSLEAKLATLTPPQRESKAKDFQKKVEELQKYAQKAEEEYYAFQEKESKQLFDAIEQTAAAFGTSEGLAVVVVKKELLYVGASVDARDVTEPLITRMNQAYQKK